MNSRSISLPRVRTLTRSTKTRSHRLLAPLILSASTGSHSGDLGMQGASVPTGYIVLLATLSSPVDVATWSERETTTSNQEGLWLHKLTTSP